MKNAKIILRFARLNDANLEAQSFAILAAMTGNTHFPEPAPSLAALNNSITLFSDSLAFAKTGDRVRGIHKNQQRQNLEQLLTRLANYCSFIANGDRFILASSGFRLNAASNASNSLGNPENFTVEVGANSGEALAYVKSVPNAKSYLFRWGIAPIVNETWLHTIHSKPWFTITGLVPGSIYSFQIGVAGTKGQTVYTDIITKMVV